ncbi:hypothetical protein [Labilibaculum antarcticum]|uniref:hypothetical protein n=1 Tax=Labilibaculum antarcticum TaxID=1717717 RepID=UPI0011AB7B91|nr:hypothetical protein [Labilibaculum antarcticum]
MITNKYKKRLNFIKKGVIQKFGKGQSTNWRNRDFEDLSFDINKASKVLISATTLKRIFGKSKTSDKYYPQESTLEAMEKYATITVNEKITILHFFKKTTFLLLIVPILIAGILLLYRLQISSSDKLISAKIELKKIDGANPATAFFHYEIPDTKDSLFVSFGDEYPLKHLLATKQLISHFYRHPGIFNVNVSTRRQVLSDTLKLFIPTTDWQALAHYYHQNYTERYFPVPIELTTGDEGFHPTRKDLANIGMDTTQIIVLRLDNFKKTGINGDTFNLKTRIKNINYWPTIRCYSAYINVIGESGLISFKLTNEGCSQFGEFTLSEKTAQGSYADLTNFSLNIKSWNEIEIKNTNQHVQVNINSAIVFQEEYNNSIGEVLGVSLRFHGSGYIDYFELLDKNNAPIFEQNF